MVFSRLLIRKSLSCCKRRSLFQIAISLILFFIVYTELLSYTTLANNWQSLKCSDTEKCLKILLIADPQITGNEQLGYLNKLAQYDIDTYLKKTYWNAKNFIKPNLTIFLGDLMDEGSTANAEDYHRDLKRFFNIYPKETGKHIYIPGDNDIGGEGSDPITPLKIQRYQKSFSQKDILKFGKFTFVKVNRLTRILPKLESKREFFNTTEIFVVLSHIPLMFTPSSFSERVFSTIQPQVIFTAHEHKAMIVSTDSLLRQDRKILPQNPEDHSNKVRFDIGTSDIIEVIVPTCSYRMGTFKIGFGYAILENDEIQYTILWLPSRFHQIGNHILSATLLIIVFLMRYWP